MGCIHLKQGRDKQQHYPLIVHYLYVICYIVEHRPEKTIGTVGHQHSLDDEQQAGQALYVLQAAQYQLGSCIHLHGLHEAEHH